MLDEIEDRFNSRQLTHYASQLLGKCLQDEADLDKALKKAITTLTAARLPSYKHFKKVYICSGEIRKDWLVSELGLRLILLNADVSNPVVARMQVKILANHLF
jgi:hypothetical protein